MTASVVAGALLLGPARASAQEDVQVAAKAFAEGQKAQLRGDFVRAAELFEIADQSVPSAAALRSAIRTRGAAGHEVRAATLALQALTRYPEDPETRAVAENAIQRFGPNLTRIRLVCKEPCTATLDGVLVGGGPISSLEFFVTPGVHVLRGSWPGRPQISEPLETRAGQALEVELTAPAAPAEGAAPPPTSSESPAATSAPKAPPPAPPATTPAPPPAPPSVEPARSGGLSPAFFWVGTALTLGGGALIAWSGRDTLEKRDEYEAEPTRARYEHGLELERRTNLLIAGTAVVGAATLAIGLFATDWGGSSNVGLALGPGHARLSITGGLP